MRNKKRGIFSRLMGRILGGHFERKDKLVKAEVPTVSQRVCPLCGELIGFGVSFIYAGDTACHAACVDMLERLERGED